MFSGSRQLKCSDKEIIQGTSPALLPSPLEVLQQSIPVQLLWLAQRQEMPTHCLLQRKLGITESHKYWLEGLLWRLQPSLLLPGKTWSVSCGFVQPSLLNAQIQTALGLFNMWGVSFQTRWCNSRNGRRTCKPSSSWIRHRIRISYYENIFRPRLCGSLTENKVYRRHLPATELKSGLWT